MQATLRSCVHFLPRGLWGRLLVCQRLAAHEHSAALLNRDIARRARCLQVDVALDGT